MVSNKMNFNETLTSIGYTIDEKDEEKITVSRQVKNARIAVIFNTKLKYIDAALIPDSLINSALGMRELNDAWEHLKMDVTTFRLHSGYKILNVL